MNDDIETVRKGINGSFRDRINAHAALKRIVAERDALTDALRLIAKVDIKGWGWRARMAANALARRAPKETDYGPAVHEMGAGDDVWAGRHEMGS